MKGKKILIRALLGIMVVGLFVVDIKVFGAIGTNMKEKRVATEKQAEETEKARQTKMKMDTADMVGRAVEEGEQVHQEKMDKLQEDLAKENEKHKKDKAIPAQAPAQLTPEEKEDLGKG